MEKSKVFIDSNVWFSAIWGSSLIKKLLVKLVRSHAVYVSELVLEEVVRNVKKKLPKELEELKEFIVTYPLKVVKDPGVKEVGNLKGLADWKDLPILAAADKVDCEWLITGNIKDFKVKEIENKLGIKVVTPRKFWDVIGE